MDFNMIDIFALFLLLLTFFVSKVRNAEMLTKLDFKMMLFLNPNPGGVKLSPPPTVWNLLKLC